MANNVFQVKRTSVAGRTPNTTSSYATNTQYIAAGELALNMTDQILYTSDGTNLISVGANIANQRITNSLTLNNNVKINWRDVYGANVSIVHQNDDNTVFYSTNVAHQPRTIWSVSANSDTSAFTISAPTQFNSNATYNGTNIILSGSAGIVANGSLGSNGWVLTSNGTSAYWISAGASSTDVTANFVWQNSHTFQKQVVFTGNGISLTSNTGGVNYNGNTDTSWRMGRNTGLTTKFYYSNNTMDIIAGASNLEGIVFGQSSGNTYLETGYAGTFTKNPIYVGNATVNVSINSTSFTGTANNATNLGGTAAASYQLNSTLAANVAILTANNANNLGGTAAASYQLNSTLAANVAILTANNANNLGGTIASSFVANTSAGLSQNTSGHFVVAGTGTVVNATGVHVNATYIGTLSANNASYLGGTAAASYQLNSTLAANVATLAANSSTYANSSVTNTFTVGTAAYFVANGNFGIGNTTPVSPLTISDKTTNPTVHITASNSTYFSVYQSTGYNSDPGLLMRKSLGTSALPSAVIADTRLGYVIGATTADGVTFNNTSALNFMSEATANATSQPTYLQFMTTPTGSVSRSEVMRISGNGNIGIGNTTPGVKLEVTGDIRSSGSLTIGTGGTYTNGSIYSDANWGMLFRAKVSGAATDFAWKSTSDANEWMRISNTGNVGIGNTAPTDKLSVNGTTYLGNTTTAVGLITGTITSANNASYLGGTAAASYVNTSGSYTLSGNLVFTGANLFFQSGSLGGTSTNFVNNFIINTNVGNASYLRFYHYRHTTGGDWTGVSTRLQQRIDVTDQGYLEFNPSGYTYGIGLYGSSSYGLTISQTGQSTFGNTVILGTVGVSANGSSGTSGHVLTSNGTATYWSATANNSTYFNSQPATYYTNATNITTGVLPWAQAPTNTVNTSGAFTITGVYTHSANVSVTGTSKFTGVVDAASANTLNQTLTDGVTITWDTSLGQIGTVTLAGNRTMAAPTNLKVTTYILHVLQDATGSRTITWNSVFKWTAGVAPVLSTGAGKRDVFSFISDGTNLYGSYLPDVR